MESLADQLGFLASGTSLLLLSIAAFYDIKERKIPNFISFLVLLCGILIQTTHSGTHILISVGSAFAMLLLMLWAVHMNWVGGGDAKLLPAVMLIVPSAQLSGLLFSIALLGALLAFLVILGRKSLLRSEQDQERQWEPRSALSLTEQLKCDLPYGLAIFLGALFYVPVMQ